ncbi:MAG TPA: PQQ-binding-like beta-propeller repeat protein, partial [Planctomycetaceae bacterium]|nr:PQQ-binding-like beta-propeller repeat protein [Planctomycetaceae bacterium]
MLTLEIHFGTGDVERRELSKTMPISIGRHVTNDVAIDEEGVGVLHCRISWNGSAFEAVAAGRDGVDYNGSLVRHAALRAGDVLRIGSVDFEVRDSTHAPPDDHVAELDIDLKPITSDAIPLHRVALPPRTPTAPKPAPAASRRPEPEENVAPAILTDDPWNRRQTAKPEPVETGPRLGAPARPGEQDLLRSPLILGLGGGVLALALTALTLWFVIGRESSNRRYDLAVQEIQEHRYSQGIQSLEAFLHDYPHHRRAAEGRRVLGESRIEQSLAGAAPAWNQAFERLEAYINSVRNDSDFKALQPRVQSFAERIGVGAAEAAASNRKRELLDVSAAASRVLQGYAPEGDERKRALQRVAAASRKAEKELTRFETHVAALQQIDAAIGKRSTLEALRIRRRLLDDYPDFRNDVELQKRMQSILKLEQDSVTSATPETPAIGEPKESEPKPLTFVRHTRARTDIAPSKTQVFFVAGDTCFACDSATGEPIWRRVIGLDPPFAPITVSIDVLALLLWDSRTDDLLLVRQNTGAVIWRQHVGARAVGAPAIEAGQILLSVEGGRLLQIDLIDGQWNAELKFAQGITAPAIMSDNRAIVAAEHAILYILQ